MSAIAADRDQALHDQWTEPGVQHYRVREEPTQSFENMTVYEDTEDASA